MVFFVVEWNNSPGMRGYVQHSHLGSFRSGYVMTPIRHPLSTGHTPPVVSTTTDNGWLSGTRPTPSMFGPSPVSANMYSNLRHVFQRAYPTSYGKPQPQQPMDASARTGQLRQVAVGQQAYKVGLSEDALVGSKAPDHNQTRQALRRMRSTGSVAPPKKYLAL